jgi:excisionase family DNA binding protein
VAFGPDGARAERVGADCWVADLDDVVATLERWERTPPSPRAAVDEPTAFEELERQRPALLAATVNIGGADGEVSEWAHRTARSVVTHLAVAALVNDPTVLSDHLEAERRNLRRNNLLDVHLLGLIDALAGALPAEAGPATAYVLASREELRRSLLSPRPARPPEDEPEQANQAGRPLRSVGGGAEGSPRPAEASGAPAIGGPGQVFADILLLAALACQTPLALVSVPQGSGQWSTLSYGFEQRAGLNDPALFDYVAARSEPVEIPDLTAIPMLAGSPLAAAPHNLRWAYAVALRNPAGVVLGVVVVLDRWLRDLSRREQRALAAVARQMTGHLSSLRKVPASGAAQGAWTPPQGALQGPALKPAQPVDALAGIVGLRRSASLPDGQQLLRSHEVAVLFDVTERTVINWAAAGKLPSLRTIGGHLRFRSEDVLELLSGRTSGAKAAR